MKETVITTGRGLEWRALWFQSSPEVLLCLRSQEEEEGEPGGACGPVDSDSRWLIVCVVALGLMVHLMGLLPRLYAPCCWSRRSAGWTEIYWGCHCVGSCQWPEYTCTNSRRRRIRTGMNKNKNRTLRNIGLTWWFPLWSVCTGPSSRFWRCCSRSKPKKTKTSGHSDPTEDGLTSDTKNIWSRQFPSLPFPGSQKPQRSDGSPAERCRCSVEQVQFERWSEKWLKKKKNYRRNIHKENHGWPWLRSVLFSQCCPGTW